LVNSGMLILREIPENTPVEVSPLACYFLLTYSHTIVGWWLLLGWMTSKKNHPHLPIACMSYVDGVIKICLRLLEHIYHHYVACLD
jgi:hypothetical protein